MEILNHFKNITLTEDQSKSVMAINSFFKSPDSLFILKGYAGSGKTTILKGICSYLNSCKKSFHLIAPTGRAAMVIQKKTKYSATTIHKAIYNYKDLQEKKEGDSFQFIFGLNANENTNDTIYIVDEASMISDVYSEGEFFRFGSGRLLKDLISFVFEGSRNQKIIFIGDNAQLPPVGMDISPALNKQYLINNYNITPLETEMTQVVRQTESSGVLSVATAIRKGISEKRFNSFSMDFLSNDIHNVGTEKFINKYTNAAKQDSLKNTIVIAHSNKQVQTYNKIIREKRFGFADQIIQRKDRLIITKNNYNNEHVLLNGMFVEVEEVGEIIYTATPHFNLRGGGVHRANLKFREIVISINKTNYLKTVIIENLLVSDKGNLHPYDQRALFIDFKNRMKKQKYNPQSEEFKKNIKTDKYFNAIQAKYGYAITCHKSQGGEWKNVFVDFNVFIGRSTLPYYRWAYTAITRTNNQLYCIDAPKYNALSEYVVKNTLTINKISPKMYFVLNDLFVEHRVNILEALCKEQNIQFCFQILNYQLQCTFIKEESIIKANLWFTKKGFTKTSLTFSENKEFNEIVQYIVNQSILPKTIPFKTKFDFQNDLHNYIEEILAELDVKITNIIQNDWSDEYFIKTEAECASIEFHYNNKHFYTSAQPKSILGAEDEKLKLIVQKLKGENYVS